MKFNGAWLTIRSLFLAGGLGWLLPFSAAAQTATWDWQCQGQTTNDSCSVGGTLIKSSLTYPDSTNWSQSVQYGTDPCGDTVKAAPSNWTTASAPGGPTWDVILGNQGGNFARLDINVTLHSLTILPTGGLIMNGGTSLTASNINLQGDVTINSSGPGGVPGFFNPVLLIKSGGTNEATIAAGFTNQNGTIEVDSGRLSLGASAYAQGSGTLIIRLGGTNTGQSGELLCGAAHLGGPLTVTLTNGFVPASGAEFQILGASSVSGTFSTVNIPAGLTTSYRANGVFLVSASGPAPVRILTPQRSGVNFVFSFQTAAQQSYTIQQSTNLAATNWLSVSNFTGNGGVFQFSAPIGGARGFYRVREP